MKFGGSIFSNVNDKGTVTDEKTALNDEVSDSIHATSEAALSSVAQVLGGYKPGFKLVDGAKPDALEHFIVLSVRGTARLLLPTSNSLMQTAIIGFLGNRRFANILPRLVQTSFWTSRLIPSVGKSEVSLIAEHELTSPLRDLIVEVLGRDDFSLALRLSFGRPNAKTVAMAISNTGEALCYVKIGSECMTDKLVAHEGAVLKRFEDVDELPIVMPYRLHSGAWTGKHNVLITAPLDVEPLKHDATNAHRAANEFTSRFKTRESSLVSSPYWHRTQTNLKNLFVTDSDHFIKNTVSRIEETWGNDYLEFGASHGDWTRANLGIIDGRIAAFDWERYTDGSPQGIDIAHFAIAEFSSFSHKRALNLNRLASNLRQYCNSTERGSANVELTLVLALLEMVCRFKSAENVGLQSSDMKFGSTLQLALKKWSKEGHFY